MIDLAWMLILEWLNQKSHWPRDQWVHVFHQRELEMRGHKTPGQVRITIEYIPDSFRDVIVTGADYLIPQAQMITGEKE